jgi:hypothetical protein
MKAYTVGLAPRVATASTFCPEEVPVTASTENPSTACPTGGPLVTSANAVVEAKSRQRHQMRTMFKLLDDGLGRGQLHSNESRPVERRVREQIAELKAVDSIGDEQFVVSGDLWMSFARVGKVPFPGCGLGASPEVDQLRPRARRIGGEAGLNLGGQQIAMADADKLPMAWKITHGILRSDAGHK